MIVNSLSRFFDLPLLNWYPGNVPLPASHFISIDCRGRSEEEIIREAITHTYNIDEDSIRFRLSPSDFEKLRGDYPLRREFPSYTIDLKHGSENIKTILISLGFNIKD